MWRSNCRTGLFFSIHLFFMRWLFFFIVCFYGRYSRRMSEYFYRAWSSGLQPASFLTLWPGRSVPKGSLRWKQKFLLSQPVASLTPQPFRNCAIELSFLYSIFVCLGFHLLGLHMIAYKSIVSSICVLF